MTAMESMRVTPIGLNSGTIRDTVGNNANLAWTVPDLSSVLVDALAPTVTGVAPPVDATYVGTQNMDFTVSFSESVTITGTPRLSLDIGGVTRYANWIGSPVTGTEHTFRYQVTSPDADVDGISIATPVDLNSGTIDDLNGLAAVLTFTPPDTSGVLVETMILTTIGDVTITRGTAMSQIDIDNTTTGNDTGVTYTCVFDTVVDGTVPSGTNCSSLPGTPSFSTSAGTLDWTPNGAAVDSYEILVTGTKAPDQDTELFVIEIDTPFITTNLLANLEGRWADTSGPGTNSTFVSPWENTFNAGTHEATLNNFAETNLSGWGGDGTTTLTSGADGPYRLVFDGTDDVGNLGTSLNSQSNLVMDMWIRPESVSTADAVVIGNFDVTNRRGFELRQASDGSGALELILPTDTHANVVAALSPTTYYKMDEFGTGDRIQSGLFRFSGRLYLYGIWHDHCVWRPD